MSRYSVKPEEWALLRLQKQGSHWLVSLRERNLTSSQREHVRGAAYKRLRSDGFIPEALIDLVEGYSETDPVQLVMRKEAGGIRMTIKLVRPTEISADVLPASEALSLFLRIMLRELRHAKKERKAAPVRTLKLVPQSVIAEVAYDLLEGCATYRVSPGLMLYALLRELLCLDHHPEAVTDVDSQEKVAFVVAQHPSIKTRELHRLFDIDPATISRWRRSTSFKQAVERCTKLIRKLEQLGKWPPKRTQSS